MFLKLDWGIIWPIVNIVVFYLLLRKFLFGPVSEVMEKRKKMISSDLDDAAQTKAEAEEIKQEYEKNLAQAKDEAGQIVSDARARAKNEYQNKMDQTKEEIALMRENARKDIEAEKQKTIAGLQTEIAGIALMAASKVVEKEANDKGNEKLLDDFLKEAGVYHMKRISMTYGQVLFELGIKKESLQKAQDMLHENEELLSALENPTITKKEKENVVEKLFPDDIKSFLKVVCDNDDIACFDEAVEYYDELKCKTDKIIKAEFDYVTMPKDEQLERIKQYLMKQYQADKVELTLKEEKDLIGGFVLKVGDHVYDNSLSGKMRKLQQKLTWR